MSSIYESAQEMMYEDDGETAMKRLIVANELVVVVQVQVQATLFSFTKNHPTTPFSLKQQLFSQFNHAGVHLHGFFWKDAWCDDQSEQMSAKADDLQD